LYVYIYICICHINLVIHIYIYTYIYIYDIKRKPKPKNIRTVSSMSNYLESIINLYLYKLQKILLNKYIQKMHYHEIFFLQFQYKNPQIYHV